MTNFKKLKNCLCCNNSDIRTILDLGNQPLANEYHKGEKLNVFPLKLNLCQNCWHLQLSHAVNPDLMFRNYLYVSGTSNTLRKYFDKFVDITLSYNKEAKNVLDIACNDGSQLDSYKKIGIQTYGIDPAENIYKISKRKGHNILLDYFNDKSVNKFGDTKFDIITAQNVFAHNTYPLEFLNVCKKILSDNGHIFIQTSQANMIINNEFDTIYHEHISFFNTFSMLKLIEKAGLYLNDVLKTNIHGTSYVFVISKNQSQKENVLNDVNELIENKLNNTITYIQYALNAYKITYKLKDILTQYKNKGYKLVGYGAAAKGNTLLNFGKIELDYIVDDNPLKQGLLTPGMDIEIKSPEFISTIDSNDKVIFIPLAWNFYKEIRSKIKNYRNIETDIFIKYFPKLTIEN
jgi:2-polyprenyl-3-methyl-5-hydroxy-6-metoxy-1,4-benzoquinol methylase